MSMLKTRMRRLRSRLLKIAKFINLLNTIMALIMKTRRREISWSLLQRAIRKSSELRFSKLRFPKKTSIISFTNAL